MSSYTTILIETHEKVGLIRLDRPKALNALNSTLMTELIGALKAFDADDLVGAIVITSAEEALHYGLINRVVPVEGYLDEALELASEIAARAPLAVRMGKETVNHAFESFLEDGLADERRAFYFLFATEDQKEGMQAFVEKRPAQWKGN